MKYQFAIKWQELKAVSLFASKDEIRYILNSVRFEYSPGNPMLMVAIQGHVLGAIASEIFCKFDTSFDFCLTNNFVKDALSGGRFGREIKIEYDSDSTIRVQVDGSKHIILGDKSDFIDGTYPKWRHVIPTTNDHKSAAIGLTPDLINKFCKAADILRVTGMEVIESDSLSPVLIFFPGFKNFLGVIMPMRIVNESSVPGWALKA